MTLPVIPDIIIGSDEGRSESVNKVLRIVPALAPHAVLEHAGSSCPQLGLLSVGRWGPATKWSLF
jgi:hypothetical protein